MGVWLGTGFASWALPVYWHGIEDYWDLALMPLIVLMGPVGLYCLARYYA
jgi:hypothetical protein